MSGVGRARIADLLGDETLSYRAIGRMTGASDWTVRRIARELDGDGRPMKSRYAAEDYVPGDAPPLTAWLVFGGFVAVAALAIWACVRWAQPLNSADVSRGFCPNPPPERYTSVSLALLLAP
jgi:hypothetical protein